MTLQPSKAVPAASDGELIQRLRRRDLSALEELYERHSAYVMGIALRIIRSPIEAEDVLQDVFWQLWRSELRYDPERGRFTTWLFAVARNRALDRARQLGRLSQRTTFAEPLQDDGHGPEEDTAFSERRRAVRLALASLTPEQRRTIELAFFEGLTHREIADRVAEPLGTVKSRIKRGMEKLKELLVDHGART